MKKSYYIFFVFYLNSMNGFGQNSIVGDGFGGRLWYKPTNYSVGSYSGYSVCGDSNQLYGWGTNNNGQLGNGTLSGSETPIKVNNMTNVKFYTCGYIMGAIKNDNSGWYWGYGRTQPIKVIDDVKFVDAGTNMLSYVKNDGTIWTLGYNNVGSFGNGLKSQQYTIIPNKMDSMTDAVRVAVGLMNIIILKNDGSVWATGRNGLGGLGISNYYDEYNLSPKKINLLKDIVDIKSCTFYNIALDSKGDVYIWGTPNKGHSNEQPIYFPVKIQGLKNIVAISSICDGYHTLLIDNNKKCYAIGTNMNEWGANGGKTFYKIDSTDNYGLNLIDSNVIDILAGESFSYLVKNDGSLWACGSSKDSAQYGASIWLNLPNNSFKKPRKLTQINPELLNLCRPKIDYFIQENKHICEGDTYKINNHAYTINGIYTDTLLSHYLTDSVIQTNLIVLSKSYYSIYYNLCEGDTIKINQKSYFTSGVFSDTLINFLGCDSILTINVLIKAKSYFNQHLNLCFGENYKINKNIYSNSGIYKDTLINYQNCDSIITTNLVVKPLSAHNQTISICEGDSIKIKTHFYSASGTYKDSFMNYLGCDSIVTTYLTIKSSITTNLIFEICPNDTVFYQTKIFTQAGFYSDTLSNYFGCDSIVNIIVNYYSNLIFCDDADIFIPNSFSPNNDETNDVFKPIYKNVKNAKMQIFNRWGENIFESNNLNEGWDGIFKNNLCQESVYLYLINIQGTNGKLFYFKGTVTLLK